MSKLIAAAVSIMIGIAVAAAGQATSERVINLNEPGAFDARNVSYAPILLTSDPPKRRLSFALDDTRYEAVVTLTNVRAEIDPLR